MTRDVVPQAVEPRGFLRRRRSEDRPAEEPLTPAAPPPAPVEEAPRHVPVAVTLPGPVAVHRPEPAPRPEPAVRAEPDELLRAKDTLLQAALRQNEELSTALLGERHLRQRETEWLTAENELLRDALAALNTDALARQRSSEVTPVDAALVVPEQRDEVRSTVPVLREPAPSVETALAQPAETDPPDPDVASRTGRRRSARRAGPA